MGAPVNHKRMRPKESAPPTAAQERHHDRVRALGCLISGRPATIHHPTAWGDRRGRLARDHDIVVPLAPEYHFEQYGPQSVEKIGHQKFYDTFGICLRSKGEALRDESRQMGILP